MLIQSPNFRRGPHDERRQIPTFPNEDDAIFRRQGHGEAAFVDGLLGVGKLANEPLRGEGEGVIDLDNATAAVARAFDGGVGGGEEIKEEKGKEEEEEEDEAWWPSSRGTAARHHQRRETGRRRGGWGGWRECGESLDLACPRPWSASAAWSLFVSLFATVSACVGVVVYGWGG